MSSPMTRVKNSSARSMGSQAANGDALNKAARVGFLAKGLVYALIGVLAFEVAGGHSARADQKGALQKVSEQPYGPLLL
jgi:Domain of Unknown Function (DUF1206)